MRSIELIYLCLAHLYLLSDDSGRSLGIIFYLFYEQNAIRKIAYIYTLTSLIDKLAWFYILRYSKLQALYTALILKSGVRIWPKVKINMLSSEKRVGLLEAKEIPETRRAIEHNKKREKLRGK